MSSMDSFFHDVVPLLKGRMELERFLESQGPSPSAEARFAFYTRLMRRNVHRVLETIYGRVRAALEAKRKGSFAELADAYDEAYPPTGWDLNLISARFPEFLAAEPARQEGLPYLAEAADWAFTRFSLARVPLSEFPGLLLPATVRQYSFNIPAWHAKGVTSPPAAVPVSVLVFRAADDEVRYQRATREDLLALADAQGLLEVEVPAAQLALGRERLAAVGILPAPVAP